MNPKIHITGASGFIGQNLIPYLKGLSIKVEGVSLRKKLTLYLNEGDSVVHLAGLAHDLKKSSNPEDYFKVNAELTKDVFTSFLNSDASTFIYLSSIKAIEGKSENASPYAKSKLLAEQYILSKKFPKEKRVYILRPVMVHGPGNKGNLNLLFNVVKKGIPWPLAAFDNKRSFLSVENLCFVIEKLISDVSIPSGVYDVADKEPLSTNELVELAASSLNKKVLFWKIPKSLIKLIARLGDILPLPMNSERLEKLTGDEVVDSSELVNAIGKELPVKSRQGLKKTFSAFNK